MNSPSSTPRSTQNVSTGPSRPPARWKDRLPKIDRSKIKPAIWSISSIISLIINVILIIVLIVVLTQLFAIKKLVADGLIGGLYTNFVKMDQAHIVTTIQVKDTILVKDTIPVVFNLPLHQKTVVQLTEDTPVKNATIYLNRSPVPLDLVLRKGTQLSIALDLTVPVSQTIPIVLNVPINLTVPVDIALDQTDLHEPFVGLQGVVSPYHNALKDLPSSWSQALLCGPLTGWLCDIFVGDE